MGRDYWQGFCEHDNEPSCFIIGLNYFQKRAQNQKRPGWYLNFSICFMENLIWTEKDKLMK